MRKTDYITGKFGRYWMQKATAETGHGVIVARVAEAADGKDMIVQCEHQAVRFSASSWGLFFGSTLGTLAEIPDPGDAYLITAGNVETRRCPDDLVRQVFTNWETEDRINSVEAVDTGVKVQKGDHKDIHLFFSADDPLWVDQSFLDLYGAKTLWMLFTQGKKKGHTDPVLMAGIPGDVLRVLFMPIRYNGAEALAKAIRESGWKK